MFPAGVRRFPDAEFQVLINPDLRALLIVEVRKQMAVDLSDLAEAEQRRRIEEKLRGMDRAEIRQLVDPVLRRMSGDEIRQLLMVELRTLSGSFPLAGGNIKNIVVDAAVRAMSTTGAGVPVIMLRHLIASTAREYQKLGKPITPGEFGETFYQWVAEDILSSTNEN